MGDTSNSQVDVDKILLFVGPRGRYQTLQFIVGILSMFPCVYQLLSNVFTCQTVPHRCASPGNDSNFKDRFLGVENVTYTYDACEIRVTSGDELLAQHGCIFGIEYDLPVQASAISQFDLVCDRSSLAGLSQTLVIAGQGVGAVLTTMISDRKGRKVTIIGGNLGLLVCGLVIAYAPNYIVFALFKFFIGAFQQASVTSFVTFILELLTMKDRRFSAFLTGFTWNFGVMSLALFAYVFKDHSWNTLQMAWTLTSLAVFIQWWYLDESLRWLIANGKIEVATKVLKRAAKQNRKKTKAVLEVFLQHDPTSEVTLSGYEAGTKSAEAGEEKDNSFLKRLPHDDKPSIPTPAKKMTLLDILRFRRLFINSLVMWFSWFTTALGFFALYFNSTSLSGNKYLNFTLTALMEFPPVIVLYFAVNSVGRRKTGIVFFAVLGLSLLGSGVCVSTEESSLTNNLNLVFSLLGMVGASGSFAVVYLYTPELFPTNVRNQALGLSSMMGRIGGMLAPFTGVLAERAKWAPSLLIGCCAFLVSVLLKFVPETGGRELPQTVEDVLAWHTTRTDDKQTTKNGSRSIALDTLQNLHITESSENMPSVVLFKHGPPLEEQESY